MRIILIALVFVLTLYALLDCARMPDGSMPVRIPKYLWTTLVVLFPTIGPIVWVIFSRAEAVEERGDYAKPIAWSSKEGAIFRCLQRPRPMVPDGNPEFPRDLERDIHHRKHHPQGYTGAPDASNDGVDEDPEAGETGGADRSGTDSH